MSSQGLPAPGSKKLKTESKKSRKSRKRVEISVFDSVSTLFITFWAPGPEAGNSFSTPFPTLGPKGPITPLGGGGIEGSQHKASFHAKQAGTKAGFFLTCPLSGEELTQLQFNSLIGRMQ